MNKIIAVCLLLLVASSNAFTSIPSHRMSNQMSTSSQLYERQWNFNDSPRGPFGMKKNAEIWNGRVAQMGFTIVLLQELITGKGVIVGLQEGNFVNMAFAGATAAAILALSATLAIKGKSELAAPAPVTKEEL